MLKKMFKTMFTPCLSRFFGNLSGKSRFIGILIVLFYVCQFSVVSANIVVISSTSGMVEVRVSIPEVEFHEIKLSDGNIYSTLIVPGAGRLAIGKPDVPGFGKWILIPNGTDVDITHNAGESIIYENVNLAPVQPLAMDYKGAPEPPFTKDETVFSTDADYPGIFAETEPIKHKRGQSCTILWIYPYRYNPVQKRLTVYPDLEVTVHFSGIIEPLPSNLRNETMEQNLKAMAINAEAVLSAEKDAETSWRDLKERADGCELLIITHPDFQNAADTLAAWKIRRGIYTKVANTTTTGNTTNDIESYIDNAYNNWNPAPSYLLFIGDAEFIPTWYKNWHPDAGDPYFQGHTGTDFFYADIEDPPTYVPEFGYGRLSVDTDAEADSLVARIIRYERKANPNSYYTHTTMACCFQDGSGAAPDGIADRRFAKTSEDIRNYLDTQGYTTERIYTTYNAFNGDEVFPEFWNDGPFVFENDIAGEEIPESLQKPNFPWNGSAADITNAINSGRFFITHRDHGSRSGWGDPAFNNGNVDALNNGEERPIVWTINCQTGWFDNETDDAECGTGQASECFVEHWIRHSTGGSCGLIGATRISYSGINDRLVWGWMDAIWPTFTTWCNDPYGAADPIYKMGDVLNYGKEYMRTKYALDEISRTALEEFHWFGDPTMEMWTSEPNLLTSAEVTSGIVIGTSSITVQVTPAIENMLVAVCTENADSLFGTAETNGAGIAIVDLNHAISMAGTIYITVTKHDYLPYEFSDSSDPYHVATAADLNCVRNYPDSSFIQIADINLSGYSNWDPIGTSIGKFTGSYNGNGYIIDSLKIDRTLIDDIGLFGCTDGASIENVALTNVDVSGDDDVGGLVGDCSNSTIRNCYTTGSVSGDDDVGGLMGECYNNSTISNCYTTGSVIGSDDYVGGLVGDCYNSIISNCYTTGLVSGADGVGGLVGCMQGDIDESYSSAAVIGSSFGYSLFGGLCGLFYDGTLQDSYSTGNITGIEESFGDNGGFVGWVGGGATITRCYATGNVASEGSFNGGFIGYCSACDISECYATGNLTLGNNCGGFIGASAFGSGVVCTITNCYASGNVDCSFSGGFISWNNASWGVGGGSTIENCYSTGAVSAGNGEIGGFCYDNEGVITNCFWDTQTSGQSTSAGGTGKTTAEMKTQSTYTGWDFTDIWERIGYNYPRLKDNPDPTLPVILSTFTAQYLNNVPTLYWRTMSETDNIGWYVYRNKEEDFEQATRITNDLIEGYGTTTEPHDYFYYDEELEAISGDRYRYWIENIDFGGAFHRYGPKVLTIPDIPDDHSSLVIPKQYGLHQNKPNPLSMGKETTKISFLLPKTARAELKIYNIRGELIKDLYNDIAYGDDEVKLTWDGRDENGVVQGTGIYLYQLKVNGKTFEVKRMITIR